MTDLILDVILPVVCLWLSPILFGLIIVLIEWLENPK